MYSRWVFFRRHNNTRALCIARPFACNIPLALTSSRSSTRTARQSSYPRKKLCRTLTDSIAVGLLLLLLCPSCRNCATPHPFFLKPAKWRPWMMMMMMMTHRRQFDAGFPSLTLSHDNKISKKFVWEIKDEFVVFFLSRFLFRPRLMITSLRHVRR